jgi:hypothetical protein
MRKNYFYLAFAMMLFAVKGYSQAPCATDEMHKLYKQQHPEIAEYEKQLNESIAAFIAGRSNAGIVASKTTATHSDTDYYDIPVVVHIVHNYGSELVKDSIVYGMIRDLNTFYSAQNNLAPIIQPFKKYIGNAKIRFHLATKDPLGNPTTGITHRLSYLTYGGDDQAKFDLWPPHNYYNIWSENVIGRGTTSGIVLAYSTFPSSAEAFPYNDGVISRADRLLDVTTIPHESGHYFDLLHPWNSGTGVGEVCGDDEVDDTPPTKGHFSVCGSAQLYDTTCAVNYYKIYVSASGLADSLVNYPDTTNTQNVMDYSDCPQVMLTKGQVWRMRAALNNVIGGRNNLWDSTNLAATGALATAPDLQPIADFVPRQAVTATAPIAYFTFPDVNLYFTNKSWRDTVTKVSWSFSNGASKPTYDATGYAALNNSVDVKFSEPGWVSVKMDVTGNNSGTSSTTFDKAVYVTENAGVSGVGYLQEFNEGGDREKWPMFNYYNNNFKWKYANVGVFDNSSVMYEGFDSRSGLDLLTGSPKGDFDDLFSVPFDLSAYASGECNLNFHYSSASRTSSSDNISDTLIIEYSTGKRHVWSNLATLGKGKLINKGAVSTSYVPSSFADWSAMTIPIPAAARTPYTVFRFRYRPGVFKGATSGSTGNNFYMDRVHVSQWIADVSTVKMGNIDVKVVPNPTHGDAYIVVKDVINSSVDIVISDITGKVVYRTSEQLQSNGSKILIPQQAIATKGVYLVQTTTGSQVNTQKLVVY